MAALHEEIGRRGWARVSPPFATSACAVCGHAGLLLEVPGRRLAHRLRPL